MSKVINRKKGYIRLFGIGIALGIWYLFYLWTQAVAEDGAKGVHLEWQEPAVSFAELKQGRENEAKGSGIYLYVWQEEEGSVRNPETGQEVSAALLTGMGEMREALPVQLLSGTYLSSGFFLPSDSYPSSEQAFSEETIRDTEGCLVSQNIAEALWGSQDVTGQPLVAGGRNLIIRGVTKEKRARVYCLPESEKWEQEKCSNLEVYTAPEAAAAETARTQKALAEAFLSRHGFPAFSSGTDYHWQSGMKLTATRLVGLVLALCLMVWYVLPAMRILLKGAFLEQIPSEDGTEDGTEDRKRENYLEDHSKDNSKVERKRGEGQKRKILSQMFLLLFLFLLVLFVFKSIQWVVQDLVIPEDWIPPAWSDFDFWGEKWREITVQPRI